jgi:hypothetical protein
MSEFFWSSGHLGWGFFSILVYSGMCIIAADLVWRLTAVSIRRLVPIVAACWVTGVALLVLLTFP